VIREAYAAAVGWLHALSVSINVSPLQLADESLLPTLLKATQQLDHHRVTLEVTESALLVRRAQDRPQLRA
jgi:EAL domain-containing protein (putative c-di-GMP-specific phosphodiesterase class I)